MIILSVHRHAERLYFESCIVSFPRIMANDRIWLQICIEVLSTNITIKNKFPDILLSFM